MPKLIGRHTDPQLGETPLTKAEESHITSLISQVSIISEPSVKNG